MSSLLNPAPDRGLAEEPASHIKRRLIRCAKKWPFTCLFGLAVFSNVAASLFSIGYNHQLIVSGLNPEQKVAFTTIVLWNNGVMFSICMVFMILLFRPLYHCRRELKSGRHV